MPINPIKLLKLPWSVIKQITGPAWGSHHHCCLISFSVEVLGMKVGLATKQLCKSSMPRSPEPPPRAGDCFCSVHKESPISQQLGWLDDFPALRFALSPSLPELVMMVHALFLPVLYPESQLEVMCLIEKLKHRSEHSVPWLGA